MVHIQQRSALLLQAKRQTGELHGVIHKWLSNPCRNSKTQDLETYYWEFHQIILKARSVVFSLSTLVEFDGDDPDCIPELNGLRAALEEIAHIKSAIDTTLYHKHKKGSLRAFKSSLAEVLEKGKGPHWISTVSKEEIDNTGGESNRLYQLLIEGKASDSLYIDSATLRRASKRIDLFSEKQIENLKIKERQKSREEIEQIELIVEELNHASEQEVMKGIITARSTDIGRLVEAQEGTHSLRWECAKCTFVNPDSSVDMCRMCSASKGGEQASFVEVAKKKAPKATDSSKHLQQKIDVSSVMKRFRKGTGRFACWILNADVPDFIGPSGHHVQTLKKRTGVDYVSAEQDHVAMGWCPITILGGAEAVRKAITIVEQESHERSQRYSKTIWIDGAGARLLLGGRASDVNGVSKKYGCAIHVDPRKLNSEGLSPVHLSGVPRFVDKASSEIIRLYGPKDQGTNIEQPKLSNKAGSAWSDIVKKTIWILDADVPELIGVSGVSVQRRSKRHGVKSITAWQNRLTNDEFCPIEIKGNLAAVNAAAEEIVEEYCGRFDPPPPRRDDLTLSTRPEVGKPKDDRVIPLASEEDYLKDFPTSKGIIDGNQNFAGRLLDISEEKMPAVEQGEESVSCHVDQPTPQVKECQMENRVEVGSSFFTLNTQVSAPKTTEVVTRSHTSASENNSNTSIVSLLTKHMQCLKVDPFSFVEWLKKMDIVSMEDFKESLEDENFVAEEMVPHGLKRFKLKSLVKVVKEEIEATHEVHPELATSRNKPPDELICPIGLVLMVRDPVIASDGYTYEREEIEKWFTKPREPNEPILSPKTGRKLTDTNLTPNQNIRTMARDFARGHPPSIH